MPRLVPHWSFKAWDPIRKRWYTSRYRASLDTIKDRHGDEYQLLGSPVERLVYDRDEDVPANTRPR